MTVLSHELVSNWDISSRREWLVTNGIGGYASSSIAGANTRRYHGLLVAACTPPLGRTVVLSKLEEEIHIEDQVYQLSANKYPSVIYPQGYRHLIGFDTEPVTTFTYSVHEGTVTLQKQIWMPHGENTVYIRYTMLKAPEPVSITLFPFVSYKDYHSELHKYDGFTGNTCVAPDGHVEVTAYEGALTAHLRLLPSEAFLFTQAGRWYFSYEHEREQERGQDASEDLYCPGSYTGILSAGRAVTFVATVEQAEPASPHESLAAEVQRRDELVKDAKLPRNVKPFIRSLVLAADQFVIPKSARVNRATVIAGYPWFTDWGRDTMIALPGLCLATGRRKTAREILESFANALTDGLIPNRFTDGGAGAEFNTVDATLWLFQAAYAYAKASTDWEFLTRDLYEPLEKSLRAHYAGTHFNIHVDTTDGLLYAGEPGVQLTWMDARVGDHVITPRIGKPVEIQALWFNALKVMIEVAKRADRPAKDFSAWANQAQSSFVAKYPNPATGCLFDVVDGPNGNEDHIRPNQIFALSLAFPILDPKSQLAADLLAKVTDELLTIRGLRTLAPEDSNYIAHYGPGDQTRRDAAYHQGTVWPWLIGPYVNAHRAVKGVDAKIEMLTQIDDIVAEYGVGSIAEIYDGDEPHGPNGCIAQAWSVSEILRVLLGR
ncbi:MAG TPA: amylo-alpha-1,6-glucosidase [Capsulimonadaceae bacterium]|jgi:predicted glycogen debranching enzyme